MLHAGLDLSRRKVDVCLISEAGEIVDEWASPPDADRLRGLAARAAMWAPGGPWGDRVDERCAVRARPARRARLGRVDRRRHQGQGAGAAGVQDRQDRRQGAGQLSARDLVPEIWLPGPTIRRERELARFRLHLVRHRTTLKNRIHAVLIARGPGPGSDLFGPPAAAAGPARDPRAVALDNSRRSLGLIDDLDVQIARLTVRAQAPGRRSPLHPAAGHCSRVRVDERLHRRLGDRRHQPLRLAGEALRLHRAVPARQPVRRQRPPRPDLQTRPQVPSLGAVRSRPERLQASALRGSATSTPGAAWAAKNADPRSSQVPGSGVRGGAHRRR